MHNAEMPRPPRLEIPGTPLHIVQRGVNRAACFFGDVDRRYYLKLLARYSVRRQCAVHAYVLMTNHVHLLLTPLQPGAAALLMQDIGRSYVRVVNAVHDRTGTLWEGRFKSSLIDSESYFLVCQKYIEMNPVRAGIVSRPGEYLWSSHKYYSDGSANSVISEHECFTRLGRTPESRRAAYWTLFEDPMGARTLEKIRAATSTGTALGSEAFIERIGRAVGRSVDRPRRGRPSKKADCSVPGTISGKLL